MILSCENKITEIRYYPTDREFHLDNVKLIGLDTTKLNFREITDKIEPIYSSSSILVLEFDDGQIKKRVIPYIFGVGSYYNWNVLKIQSDSIQIDDGYSIKELKWILKRHYLNKGKIANYSESPQTALVKISVDTSKNGKELKKLLTKLTRSFDEIKEAINDTIELRVFFDYLKPPPPPKMEDE